MAFILLADGTVILHLAFVVFVVLGGLFVLRWRRAAWAHLPAAVWGVWIELAGWICPLTPLETWLRLRGGGEVYTSSFVERYVLPVLYPASLTREVQWVLGGLVLAINLIVYAIVFRRWRRKGVT
jgi:hypothetical protein